MRFTVINGNLSIEQMRIRNVAAASSVFIGDIQRVSLSAFFETPAEQLIIGVEIPATIPS